MDDILELINAEWDEAQAADESGEDADQGAKEPRNPAGLLLRGCEHRLLAVGTEEFGKFFNFYF